MGNLRIVLFEICGADFLCIQWCLIDNKQRYKLCWVKKTKDNFHNLSFEYEVICYVETIEQAKERAKWFLDYFSK